MGIEASPIGKLRDGDTIRIIIDRNQLEGSVNFIVNDSVDLGTHELAKRKPRPDLAPDANLPADTRLWAILQNASGGVWAGCVYDEAKLAEAIGVN